MKNICPFTVGNAIDDEKWGWFIGQFIAEAGELRRRQDIEIKWGVHSAGELRTKGWSLNKIATTISILIDGQFIMKLKVDGKQHDVHMCKRGDYVIINAGIEHSWEAKTDALLLTIRLPSIMNDQLHFTA